MLREYLTEKDIEQLKVHRYVSAGYSSLDLKMDPYWIYVADKVPQAFSPNMITLSGTIVQLTAIMILIMYDWTLSKELPLWLYFYFVLTIFIGQTTDAIDGKIARKTNRCSPLGELIDHGLDHLITVLVLVMVNQSQRLGDSTLGILQCIVVQMNYLIANWCENINKERDSHLNNFGITEYQFITMAMILVPALLGNPFFDILIFGLSLPKIIVLVNIILGINTSFQYINRGSTSRLKELLPLIPLFIAYILSTQLFLFHKYPILITLIDGLPFSLLGSKQITHNMSHVYF